MNPIVSPWWFYLINLTSNLSVWCWILGSCLGIGVAIWGIICLMEDEWDEWGKKIKKLFITTLCLIFIGCATPSESTCYKMMAAGIVTPDNINAVGNTATDIIDYIVDSVDQLLEEGEGE